MTTLLKPSRNGLARHLLAPLALLAVVGATLALRPTPPPWNASRRGASWWWPRVRR